MAENKSIFVTLNAINVAPEKKTKQNLSYLSWAKAWELLQKQYPDASFEVERFDGKPWQYDEKLGYMVHTSVTIQGVTRKMWLPIMDSNNMAMKDHPYSYTVGKGDKKQTKTVEAADMRDISDATMRCLVKNIALFGLGLNFYYGEDISKEAAEELQREQTEAFVKQTVQRVMACTSQEQLNQYTQSLQGWETEPTIKEAIINRAKQLKNEENRPQSK